ncbi:TPA: hypothetical protein N0F65_007266 [Lagenidium giganteum]|uniref:Uncharacterized protein n=1 Tax=Lagenidium giganteum TaxID=4803 RepID=A0AAV2YSL1_9STRA|nr:TPA: hypothetical protein N0F65_007266 [Lagenidium giganteum]
MAKSDFVQAQNLKALIQNESLDEASTAPLANLFVQVMSINREYEYDECGKAPHTAHRKRCLPCNHGRLLCASEQGGCSSPPQ